MNKRRNLVERVITAAELEAQLQPGLPIIELAGTKRVLVENHLSVVQYNKTEICIKVEYGCIRVLGTGLELAKLAKEQLVITGSITGVELVRRGR